MTEQARAKQTTPTPPRHDHPTNMYSAPTNIRISTGWRISPMRAGQYPRSASDEELTSSDT